MSPRTPQLLPASGSSRAGRTAASGPFGRRAGPRPRIRVRTLLVRTCRVRNRRPSRATPARPRPPAAERPPSIGYGRSTGRYGRVVVAHPTGPQEPTRRSPDVPRSTEMTESTPLDADQPETAEAAAEAAPGAGRSGG